MVNMWATWCEPCRWEYPEVVATARKYKQQGLVVMGVSFDEDADLNLVRHFLTKNDPGFPNYRQQREGEDQFIRGVSPRWDGSLPFTVIYDRQGHAVKEFLGASTPAAWDPILQSLLATAAH